MNAELHAPSHTAGRDSTGRDAVSPNTVSREAPSPSASPRPRSGRGAGVRVEASRTRRPSMAGATALLLAGLLAGCASAPPSATLLALPSLGAPGASGTASAGAGATATAAVPPDAAPLAAPVLIVRRPVLPEYLLARRVRFRVSDTVVDDWPGVFWAERIEVALTRELTAALRAQLPGWTLCEAECTAGGVEPRARTLRLEFAPLDYRRDRRELFTEVRAVLQDANGTLRQRTERRYTLQTTADTPQAHAAVLGELLRRVAEDVAPVVAANGGAPVATGR